MGLGARSIALASVVFAAGRLVVRADDVARDGGVPDAAIEDASTDAGARRGSPPPVTISPGYVSDENAAEHVATARVCYDEARRRRPGLSGTVVLVFRVGLRGRTRDIEVVRSDLRDPIMERCLERAVMSWRFSRPRGDGLVRVRYPITFTPR